MRGGSVPFYTPICMLVVVRAVSRFLLSQQPGAVPFAAKATPAATRAQASQKARKFRRGSGSGRRRPEPEYRGYPNLRLAGLDLEWGESLTFG